MKLCIDVETLRYHLSQWFLTPFKVWGIPDGEERIACFEVFANNAQEARNTAVKAGLRSAKVIV